MRRVTTSAPAMRVTIATGLLLAAFSPARAGELRFRSLTVRDGLSQSHVETITQDHDGYVWLGTAGGGLSRYDGYDFKVYDHDPRDASSLSHDAVCALHVDGRGDVWVGTRAGLNRFAPGSDSFERWPADSASPRGLLAGFIGAITSDRANTLWVGTQGLNRIDPDTGSVSRYPVGHGPNQEIQAIHEDSAGRLWVGVGGLFETPALAGDGLYLFDQDSESFEKVPLKPRASGSAPRDAVGVTAIVEDASGRIWIGTWGGGLYRVMDGRTISVPLPAEAGNNHNFLRRIFPDDEGRLWIITSRVASWYAASGLTELLEYDPGRGIVRRITSPDAAHAYTDVFMDAARTLWLGTNGSGVYFGDTLAGSMKLYKYRTDDPGGLSSSFIRAVFEDDDGVVWVGHPKGLDRLDPARDTVRRFLSDSSDPGSLPADRVQAIHRDRAGSLWVGTAGGGLSRLRSDATGFETIRHDPDDPASLSGDIVTAILEDLERDLWVGTMEHGLNRYDASRSRNRRYLADLQDHWNSVLTLREDLSGTLWIGTGKGLARFDRDLDSVVRLGIDGPVPEVLRGVAIRSIEVVPAEPSVLWLGTAGEGLVRFDTASLTARRFDVRSSGLPDDDVSGVLADELGRLWISTQRGLGRFDPSTGSVTEFGFDRGLQSIEFNRNAYHRGPGGEMFFGGVDGLNAFFPQDLRDNPHPPRVALTRVLATDRTETEGDTTGLREHRYGALPGAGSFPPSMRDVSFDFTALHFTDAKQNRYHYRLEGYDKEWRDAGVERRATYTNLKSGTYRFKVKAANAHGVWSTDEASFRFTIERPFWLTWWFYSLTGAIAVALAASVYGWRIRAQRRRQESLEREIASRTDELRKALATVGEQARKLRELDEAKSRFVANISHELRTPLTLLAGPLEDLRDGAFGVVSEEALKELDVAVRNGRRLQRLVEQLLSVSRLEAGELRLRVQQGDLVEFLRALALAFAPLAERRRIEFRTVVPDEPVTLWFDAQKLEEVFTNLLSNAFKFTPEGGTVLLQLVDDPSEERVHLTVRDSGPGIPSRHLDKVFERFYRVEEAGFVARPGTGIGLSLARELVELHGGSVVAESEVGFGSSFAVTLRRGHGHFEESQIDRSASSPRGLGPHVVSAIDDLAEPPRAENDDDDHAGDLPTVLVVEDNRDVRRLLRRYLVENYRVLETENGADGLAVARDTMPDVIVSDVLMPEMDGRSMCRAIKADPALEFIPVVLLTAKAETEDKVTGLESGADDYMTKPFDARELRARVANLIKLRHRLKARVEDKGNVIAFRPALAGVDQADSRFLGRVRGAVETGLSDEQFGVEELAAALRMSRVHLYRRLREVCGLSPAELLMETRLESAARLLTEGAGTVSEVAYGVGFKSLSHFTRRFKGKYGESPSAFRARHQETGA